MSFNWSQLGSTLGNLTTALSAAGVSSTNMPSILQQIGLVSNPNQSAELALCSQILMTLQNPMLIEALAMKLATEQGIPPAAASLAMTLAAPGVNVPQTVMEIEQIIRQGA